MIRQLKDNEQMPYALLLLADETKEAIEQYIHQCEVYVYEENGKMIGLYALYPMSEKASEIKNIAVMLSHRGKGIGTNMIEDAIIRSKDAGFNSIHIGTANGAIKQLSLYQRLGFIMYEVKWHFFTDNYPNPIYENGILCQHMIMMYKELDLDGDHSDMRLE